MTHQQQFDAQFEVKWNPISINSLSEPSEVMPHDRSYGGMEGGGVSSDLNDKVSTMQHASEVRWARQQHHEPEYASNFYNTVSTAGHRLNAAADVAPTLMHVYDSLTAAASLGTRLGSNTAHDNFEQQQQQQQERLHPTNFSAHWQTLAEGSTPLWGSPMQQQKQTQMHTTTEDERRYAYYKLDDPSTNVASQAEKSTADAYASELNNGYNFNALKRRVSSSGFSYAGGSDGGFPSESDTGAGSDSEQQQRPKQARKRSKRESGERWNKRFTWPDDMHQKFIAAVFDVGFKHATPANIVQQIAANRLDQNKDAPPIVTTESVKQQLVRYQQVHERYRREISDKNPSGIAGSPTDSSLGALRTLSSLMSSDVLETFSVNNALGLPSLPAQSTSVTRAMVETDSNKLIFEKYERDLVLEEIMFPNMSEEEKASPLGTSIGLVMALLVCIKDQLVNQRQANNSSTSSNINPYSLLQEASHVGASTSQRLTALSIQGGCKLLDTIQGCAQSLVTPYAHHGQQQFTVYSYGQENTTNPTERAQVRTTAAPNPNKEAKLTDGREHQQLAEIPTRENNFHSIVTETQMLREKQTEPVMRREN